MIGIISHEGDLHTSAVHTYLSRLGAPTILFDTAQIPRYVALTTWQNSSAGWSGEWGVDATKMKDVHVMWWRRPQPFSLSESVSGLDDRGFALGECAAAISGLWSCVDATWVNDPDRDEAASRKMWQLKVAAELGLRVPRTCMTSSPRRAAEFVSSEPGAVIFKPFGGSPTTWRETRPVLDADLALLESVQYAPVIFQEAIRGGRDVRVTVVGDQLFPALIVAGESAYEFDFRLETGRTEMAPHLLPDPIANILRKLMRTFGLIYGAIDLRLSPEGEYVFLEINPAGQWLFVELATGQTITAALADLLATADREFAEIKSRTVSRG